MAQKPPAFQFYAKDWRSSMNVRQMSRDQRSIFIDMMAIAWDSEQPGTIRMSESALCHELNILKRTLRKFLRDFPNCWRREDGAKTPSSSHEDGTKTARRRREDLIITQPKLHEQWVKYLDIQQKRSASAQQMHMQKGGSAFASAVAVASAPVKQDQKPRGAPPRVAHHPIRSEDEQRRIVSARDRRLGKEAEARKEAAVGTNWISQEIAEIARKKAL